MGATNIRFVKVIDGPLPAYWKYTAVAHYNCCRPTTTVIRLKKSGHWGVTSVVNGCEVIYYTESVNQKPYYEHYCSSYTQYRSLSYPETRSRAVRLTRTRHSLLSLIRRCVVALGRVRECSGDVGSVSWWPIVVWQSVVCSGPVDSSRVSCEVPCRSVQCC